MLSNSRAERACTIGNISDDFVSDRINVAKASMRSVESTFGWKIPLNPRWTANYTFTQSEQ